jgi:hypothetical protein
MSRWHWLGRLALGSILLVLALLFAGQAILLYLDIGLPTTMPPPNVMHITSITMFGIKLVGWQMYFVDAALALVALLLTGGSIFVAVRAFVRPAR